MSGWRGVFLDWGSVDRADLSAASLTQALAELIRHDRTGSAQLANRIAQAHVVISNKVVLDAEHLAAAHPRLVCVAATGCNNVDLAAARQLGIPVCNVTAYATPSVVQHVFSLILALTTRLEEHRRAAVDGRWARSDQFCLLDFPHRELAGKVFGVIGYGELGRSVAAVARAFGMQVRVSQRPGGPPRPDRIPWRQLLAEADIVSLHVPLAANTRNLIGAQELALMKSDALLINAARGGIVDEAALAAALRAGQLGGAGVDVLSEEPPRHGNPLLAAALPNLIVTPHVAWSSRESRQRLIDQIALNIREYRAGRERNRVN